MAPVTDYPGSGPRWATPAAGRSWVALTGRRRFMYYLLALCLAGGAVALKSVDRLGLHEAPALLFIGVVVVSAVLGGIGPGLLAAAVATAGVAFLFPPGGPDTGWGLTRAAIVAAFVVEAMLVLVMTEALRRAAFQLRSDSRRQSALAHLAADVIGVRDDAALFKAASDALVRDLPAEASIVLAPSDTDAVLVTSAGFGVPALEPPLGQRLLESCGDGPAELSDEDEGVGAFLQRQGFRSVVCAGVGLPGTSARRALVAFRKHPGPLGKSERRFLDTVAALVTAAAQRRVSEAALERSEERLRIAQGAAGIGTWEWDLQGQRMTWSEGLEVLHGLAPGAFPNTSDDYLALVHPDDRELLLRSAREAAASGRFDVRYRVGSPDARPRWIASRGRVLTDEAGAPVRVVGVGVDLTEQMVNEEQVRTSEERFRTMANAAPVLLRVQAPDGRCVFVNERWTEITGHALSEHMGFGWLDFVHADDREECTARLLASTESETAEEWEYRVCSSTGEERWMLDRNMPVRSSEGGLIGFVGSCTDITERRNAEDALRFASESGAHLASTLDYEDTLDRFAKIAVPLFADWCVIFKRETDDRVRRISVVHGDPSRADAARRLLNLDDLDPQGESIAATAIRDGTPVLVKDVPAERIEEVAAGEVHRTLLQELDIRSLIAVPMAIQTNTIGAILFVRGDSGRRFTEHDLTLAVDLGRRASISIENARLYTNLREREAALERANEMLTFLLDASAELSRTLDLDEMVERLVELAVPRLADWCAVQALNAAGEPRTLALAHRDPALADVAREMQERYPFNPRGNAPVIRALRDGAAQFLPSISDEVLRQSAMDERHYALSQRVGMRSAIVVPIRGSHETYAALAFVMSGSGRVYTEEDFATVQDLARRAGVAIDNARLYAEAQAREQELMRANEAKDEFMGMMSHELRTPLTVINGGARILRARAGELDGQTKDEILGDIEGESDRLFRMVENLLSLAHVEFSEPFDVEPVHAGHVSEKIVSAFNARRGDREVTLTVEAGAETFAAQPVYFEQVVRNLLSNADKYSPKGAAIELVVSRAGEGVGEFRVLDRGVGVDPDETDAIFERFYRSERTSRLVGGSGVGLALCKRLVEAMSGHIWARPREGGGLEVGFSLPLYEEAFV